MQSCVLKDVILDLLIGGVVQQTGGVQAFQRELDTDGFARYLTLGKADNRLNWIAIVLPVRFPYFRQYNS